MEIKGVLEDVKIESGINANTNNKWTRVNCYIKYEDTERKKYAIITFSGDKWKFIETFLNNNIRIYFDIDSSFWNDKAINVLKGYKVEKM